MHLALLARFGWSPIFRGLMRKSKIIKSKRPSAIDEAEDSGRPKVIEEAIIAASYVYAIKHNFLDGCNSVDLSLLRHLVEMTSDLEISDRRMWEWNSLLIDGFKIWRDLKNNNGGIIEGDLNTGKLSFEKLS